MNLITTVYAAGTPAAINNTTKTLPDLLFLIVEKIIIPFAGIVAVGAVVYAGILFLTSQGNPEKVTTARKALMYAVFAIILFSLSIGIITFINKFKFF